MARLRREEEARKYERMLNPPTVERFAQQFPNVHHAHLLAESNKIAVDQDDDITYAEVNRQVALVLNVLISIIACGVAIWIAARHWSIPQRLAVSMTGSVVVGVAEVVIYMGYLRRLSEAKSKELAKKEVKRITDSWVIEGKSSSTPREVSGEKVRIRNARRYYRIGRW
jgi:TMEM199 family protein